MNAMSREITLQYQILARLYHSDKWCTDRNFSKEEGVETFKAITNTRDFLLAHN